MSKEGVQLAASVLSFMQESRVTLLGGDLQDVALGQMLETGKEAMKEDFIIICDNKENKS